jgi:oxygen-independent coproporphyrinogen-3 oxidase
MIDRLEKNKFIHYEISNFGKENWFSNHNSNYWKGIDYIGFGPSAHSFDGVSRQWNISNNSLYIKNVNDTNESYFEKELLSEVDQFNEYILTSLRTIWGIDAEVLKNKFSSEIIDSFNQNINTYISKGMVTFTNNQYVLTSKGKLFADRIASELFV